MLFPVIKVKDGSFEHIVGTNSHDTLFIDKESGGIHYRSLQNEGTTERVIDGEPCEYIPYEFVGTKTPDSPWPEIEFVTFEQLFQIAIDQMNLSADREVEFNEMMQKYLEAKTNASNKVRESREKTGIRRIS